MSVDLKIETFSTKLFRHMWKKLYEVQASGASKQNDSSVTPEMSELSEVICAVYTRVKLFQNGYEVKFQEDYYIFSKSGIDFYFYIEYAYFKYSDNLNIFDRFLLVYSLVSIMGGVFHKYGNDIYIDIAPLCCAMYIDTHLKDEFYGAGGWDELKRHASTYKNVLKNVELGKSDVRNAFKIFEAASISYDMRLLNKNFQKRWNIISECEKDMDLCPKCSMLSSAFTTLLLPREYSETNRNTVESLLQLTLCMRSLSEQSVDTSNISEEFGKLDIHSESSDRSALNSKKAHVEARNNATSSGSTNQLQQTSTLNLFRKLFGDPNEIQLEVDVDLAKCSNQYSCMMCLSSVIEPLKKKSDNEKHVGSIIMKEIKSCHSEVSSNRSEPENIDTENKELNSASRCEQSENEKRTESSRKTNSVHKEPLRLFIALGTEPAKALILSEFKVSSDVPDNTQNVQNTPSKRRKRQKKKKNIETPDG